MPSVRLPHGADNVAGLLVVTRGAIISGDSMRAMVALSMLSGQRDRLSSREVIDLLERSCVYGTGALVSCAWDALAPIPYAGWALALALRTAREDVARVLLARGADLLQAPPNLPAGEEGARSLSRLDLTRGSAGILRDAFARSVSSEAFEPFVGNEQLCGGSFSTSTDVAATCDLVARLAADGLFDPLAYADLLRAVLARANAVTLDSAASRPGEAEACLSLARRMGDLWRGGGAGGEGRVAQALGLFLRAGVCDAVLVVVCELAPSLVADQLRDGTWLSRNPRVVATMVPHLAGIPSSQAPALVRYLCQNGMLAQMRQVAEWPSFLSPSLARMGLSVASAAGHAELAAWLLGRSRERQQAPDHRSEDADGDLGELGDLLL